MAQPQARRRIVVIGAAALVLVAAVAVWYLTRPAPAEVSLDAAVADVEGAEDEAADDEAANDGPANDGPANDGGAADEGTDAEQGATASAEGPADAAAATGAWTVDTSVGTFDAIDASGTFVGFRVDEELANIGATTAVGRTPAVSGEVEVDGTTIAGATIEADLTQVVSDRPRRDDRIQDALETGEFPTATFTLTDPVELGAEVAAGETASVTAPGELTVRGVTQEVEIPLEAALVDDLVVVAGTVDVVLADYGVTAPTAPIVLSVSDTATVELQLYLSPAA